MLLSALGLANELLLFRYGQITIREMSSLTICPTREKREGPIDSRKWVSLLEAGEQQGFSGPSCLLRGLRSSWPSPHLGGRVIGGSWQFHSYGSSGVVPGGVFCIGVVQAMTLGKGCVHHVPPSQRSARHRKHHGRSRITSVRGFPPVVLPISRVRYFSSSYAGGRSVQIRTTGFGFQ
ncbi:hypothetical protein H920_02710 [Fukomys damarensis]|uniref:Uncharacterized protein n=1 Tax=Fukomys damarensis TaxID=885580 RepID=A0A091DZG9_FUKDA|nr:hypothetical protein H920_02710 [Fukomys damarensis]